MRISDWSSDVCSSDLYSPNFGEGFFFEIVQRRGGYRGYGGPNAPFRIAAQKRTILPKARAGRCGRSLEDTGPALPIPDWSKSLAPGCSFCKLSTRKNTFGALNPREARPSLHDAQKHKEDKRAEHTQKRR